MYGPHVIGAPASLDRLLDESGCRVIKYLDPTSKVRLAEITIGRNHELSEEKDLSDPLGLAQRHADKAAELADVTGIPLWEGINEWAVTDAQNTDPDAVKRFVEYECERTRLLNERGLFAVVCNFGVGHPRETNGRIDWDLFDPLLKNFASGNFLGAHEYMEKDGPEAVWPFKCGRILRCPFNVPTLITECGIDLAGGQNDGWIGQGVPLDAYLKYLTRYRELMAADPRIRGLLIFTYGVISDWRSFDIEPYWLQFVDLMRPLARAGWISVKRQSGAIESYPLEEYLRGVVPSELGAEYLRLPDDPDQPDGPLHTEYTAWEALKAQAVAARLYALWRMAHPRAADFDLYDDARDQVYNPGKVHPRSDQAVQETAGIHLQVVGQPYEAQYISRCGREDCPYCGTAGRGYQGKAWPGRACQIGMQKFGTNGATFRQILRSYYPDNVTFSDEREGEDKPMAKTLYRDPATLAFQMGPDGKVTGSQVNVVKAEDAAPGALAKGATVFRVVNVRFLNEEQARGDTRILVSVIDREGAPTMAKVINAWPQQKKPRWDGQAYDWASPGHTAEFAMGGGNYSPDQDGPLGPYVIYIEQDRNKTPVRSDWCIGFGLPGNRHVAYQVTYQECAAYVDDVYMEGTPSNDPTTPITDATSGCNLVLAAMARAIESFIKK